MSKTATSYYKLRRPITHLEWTESDGEMIYGHLAVWVNDRLAGLLYLSPTEMPLVLRAFAKDMKKAMHIEWGNSRKETVVTDYFKLANDTLLISDRGELSTVRQIKAWEGWPITGDNSITASKTRENRAEK